MQPKLYLMFGYPGAGKTTIAKVISEMTGAIRLSSDEVRLELFSQPKFDTKEHDHLYTELNRLTIAYLKDGKSVVYDANLNRLQHRQEKYEICKNTGSIPVLIWVRTPKELSKTRATHLSRKHLWPSHESADDMFDRIAEVVEEPMPDESYIEIDGTQITNDYIAKKLHF